MKKWFTLRNVEFCLVGKYIFFAVVKSNTRFSMLSWLE